MNLLYTLIEKSRLTGLAAVALVLGLALAGCETPVDGLDAAPPVGEEETPEPLSEIGTWTRTAGDDDLILTVTSRQGVLEVVGKGMLVGDRDPETGYLVFGGCKDGSGEYDTVIKGQTLHLNAHDETQRCTRMQYLMGTWVPTDGDAEAGASKSGAASLSFDVP